MKKALLLLLTLIGFNGYSQQSNVIVYSEEGFTFKLMLNGVFQNEQPQSQVKLTGLNPISYKVKVVFSDTANGSIVDQINVRPYAEQYYVLKKKKVTAFEKKTKSLGNSIARDVNAKDETEAAARKEEIERMNERFLLKLHNLVELPQPAAPMQQPMQQQPVQQQPVQQRTTVVTQTPPPTVVQQTTTTTTMNGQPAGANVSMNVNLGGLAVGASVTEQSSYSQTTTTTTHGGAPVQQTVVYVPGYGGPVGCPIPMDQGSFSGAKNSINSKSFEESKLTMAKQIIGSNCLTSAQVKEIMLLFSFEETRLDFAKFAYGRTYDIGNYFMVNDAFTFETSIDDLNQYIGGFRR